MEKGEQRYKDIVTAIWQNATFSICIENTFGSVIQQLCNIILRRRLPDKLEAIVQPSDKLRYVKLKHSLLKDSQINPTGENYKSEIAQSALNVI